MTCGYYSSIYTEYNWTRNYTFKRVKNTVQRLRVQSETTIIIIMSLFRTKQVQQTDFTCVTHTILYKIVK